MPRRTIGIVLLGLLLPAVSTAAQPGRIQEGLYEGTGRACSGTLRVSQKRVTWRSSFSQCSAPADLIDHPSQGETTRWAYQLKPQKRCLYTILAIERVERPDAPIIWNVSGFPSVAAYKADTSEDSLSCPMIKVR